MVVGGGEGRGAARPGRTPHSATTAQRRTPATARRGEGGRGARVSRTRAGARKCRPARRWWWRTGVLAPPASARRRAVAAKLRRLLFGCWFCAGRRGGRGSEKRAFGWARVVPAPSPHLRRPSLRVGSPWPVHNDRRTKRSGRAWVWCACTSGPWAQATSGMGGACRLSGGLGEEGQRLHDRGARHRFSILVPREITLRYEYD